MNWDLFLFQAINGLAGRFFWLDWPAIFFAQYAGYILVIGLFVFLLKDWQKYWKMAIAAFGAAILARWGIVELIRFFFNKPRPFVENNINLLLQHSETGSFPSGHAAFFFALSIVVFLRNKKLGAVFLIASFFIAISRVFVGVHWPSDILGGALVGIFSGFLAIKIFKS